MLTPRHMSMLEEIADDREVYVSSLGRQIVECWIIENTGKQRRVEVNERDSIATELQNEIMALNEAIDGLKNRRNGLTVRMRVAARESGFGDDFTE
ncbi:MAG: hypothetical protein KAJ19_12390 [Gammaproteobacteria bacterium]|nr:hypothetical protein [Gammaproteobacteria bacterium]